MNEKKLSRWQRKVQKKMRRMDLEFLEVIYLYFPWRQPTEQVIVAPAENGRHQLTQEELLQKEVPANFIRFVERNFRGIPVYIEKILTKENLKKFEWEAGVLERQWAGCQD